MAQTPAPAVRPDGRHAGELRPFDLLPRWLETPAGSALVKHGRTWVSCTVVPKAGVPAWLRGSGRGWLTASYSLAPGATSVRTERERRGAGGRTHEIERLVGRSLRTAVDLTRVGDMTLHVDCDVLQADGGTRAAAITGGWIALVLASRVLVAERLIPADPVVRQVAAVSVGVVDGGAMVDLDYAEDQRADTDMTVVVTGDGRFVEVQASAEREPFDADELQAMLALAGAGAARLLGAQREAVDAR